MFQHPRTLSRSSWLCALILAGTATAGAQPCAFWEDHTPGPLPRWGSVMAYDSLRGVTVLFGGWPRFGDTWEWEGTAWVLRSSSGPAGRSRHHMVYDSDRGVMVLFGGRDGSGNWLNDTWEWDGAGWTQRATTGPAPRYGGGMAYDSARRMTVLFGGMARKDAVVAEDSETWEWDGTTWTQRQPQTLPPARSDCAMAYDAERGVTVLFGGSVFIEGYGNLPLTDTWEWDGTDWVYRTPIGPVPTASGPMVYDLGRRAAVIHASADPRHGQAITWQWNGTVWMPIATGAAGIGQAMAYDSRRWTIVLFGGMGMAVTGETWELTGGMWTQRASSGPLGALGPAMAYDSQRHEVVLFSSYGAGWTHGASETWLYGDGGWQKQYFVSQPSYRVAAATAYDSDRGRAVLFGGSINSQTASGETWQWDGTGWSLSATTGPSARLLAAMAYDAGRRVTVLFGGVTAPGNIASGETWEWDGRVWALRSQSGPSPRAGHAMAYDASRAVTVLFGGFTGSAASNETWEWDGTAWTQRSEAGPPARGYVAMAYDSRREVTVLLAGLGEGDPQTLYNDTWQWDGQEWIRRAIGGPAPRQLAAMVYDSDRDRLVLYGGQGLADTWLGRVPAPGDANGDDAVNAVDLLIVAQQYGLRQGEPGFDDCADFDTTGRVDVLDVLTLARRWGWRAEEP